MKFFAVTYNYYMENDRQKTGMGLEHFSGKNEKDVKIAFEKLMKQQGKVPNSFWAGEKGYAVSEISCHKA